MSEFRKAFDFMMNNEDRQRTGKVTTDAGGKTKFGISFRFLEHTPVDVADFNHDGKITPDDIVVMKFEDARDKLYLPYFWQPIHGDEIADQYVANKVFDIAVNAGVPQATHLVQQTLQTVGTWVADDGKFGRQTLAALNSVEPKKFMDTFRAFLVKFRDEIAQRRFVSADEMMSWRRRDLA